MKLLLQRHMTTPAFTHGDLYVDGVFECVTLEDTVRDEKIKGITAIPAGTYKVVLTRSDRFNRIMPLLVDVPNFEGIRIHSGNTSRDSEGCILVGTERLSEDSNWISRSAIAYLRLFDKMTAAKKKGDAITIEVKNA